MPSSSSPPISQYPPLTSNLHPPPPPHKKLHHPPPLAILTIPTSPHLHHPRIHPKKINIKQPIRHHRDFLHQNLVAPIDVIRSYPPFFHPPPSQSPSPHLHHPSKINQSVIILIPTSEPRCPPYSHPLSTNAVFPYQEVSNIAQGQRVGLGAPVFFFFSVSKKFSSVLGFPSAPLSHIITSMNTSTAPSISHHYSPISINDTKDLHIILHLIRLKIPPSPFTVQNNSRPIPP